MRRTDSGAHPQDESRPPPDREAPPAEDLLRWRQGDPAGLTALVRRFTPVLWHVARAYGLDAATAEDVVQHTWLTFLRHADEIREPRAFPGWITTVCRREALRVRKAHGNERLAWEPAEIEEPADHDDGPDEQAVAALEARRLWRHVAQLSERCQRLLRVVAFADRPDYSALSSQLGMPVGGIGPTRRRCLDKLRLLLTADPGWSRT